MGGGGAGGLRGLQLDPGELASLHARAYGHRGTEEVGTFFSTLYTVPSTLSHRPGAGARGLFGD